MTDNKKNIATFEYFESDALLIAHALMIASNRALFSQHQVASERLNFYRSQFEEKIPEQARIFGPDAWSEIGTALSAASSFSVTLEPQNTLSNGYWKEGRVLVEVITPVGPQHWTSKGSNFAKGAPEIEEVYTILSAIAPLACDGTMDAEGAEQDWTP